MKPVFHLLKQVPSFALYCSHQLSSMKDRAEILWVWVVVRWVEVRVNIKFDESACRIDSPLDCKIAPVHFVLQLYLPADSMTLVQCPIKFAISLLNHRNNFSLIAVLACPDSLVPIYFSHTILNHFSNRLHPFYFPKFQLRYL